MKRSDVAKVQHYVPQFLLRNFGTGKKRRLNVFDKRTGGTFPTNARNVAAESRFYDFEFKGRTYSLEPSLSKVDDMGKAHLETILKTDSLASLSASDRAALAVFLSIQMTRTKAVRERLRQFPSLLGDHLRKLVESEDQLSAVSEYLQVPSENDLTMEALEFIRKAPADFAPHFADKTWVLLAADSKQPFLIGDNPIAMDNTIDMGPMGNIGLAVRGIEIYLPLSPKRTLAFWCPSHEDTFRNARNTQDQESAVLTTPNRTSGPRLVDALLSAIDSGAPFRCQPQNVLRLNSLQIGYAERFVFSASGDFRLAQEMIAANPNMRHGPRLSAG